MGTEIKMAALRDVVSQYQVLTQEWNRKPPNMDKCGELLKKLKVALTSLSFLPTEDVAASKQELLVARDILEIGAQWAIAKKDVETFERYMAQLKCYYLDYNYLYYKDQVRDGHKSKYQKIRDDLPESAYRYQLLGLNLLRLLAQNKLADFHTELELLPAKDLQTNIYIKHPVAIEQFLMEGCYNKVFLARGNVPAESYNFFIDILLNTIRDEIAGCLEKAYLKINLSEAARMLFFENQKPLKAYVEQRGWKVKKDNFIYFVHEENKSDNIIPAKELATRSIEYARELEMIV